MALEPAGQSYAAPAGDLPVASQDELIDVVARFRQPLLLFFRRRLSDWALAEDLVQETMQTVIARMRSQKLSEPDRLSGFVFGTARFIASTHRRNIGRRGDVSAALSLDDTLPDTAASPEQLAYLDQLRTLVRSLMHELPQPRDRQLLWDFYVSGDSKELLLERYAMKASQFDNALYRARQRLREILLQWGLPQ
jgi:RNA polymerase sigma factor (sigma-70 family)